MNQLTVLANYDEKDVSKRLRSSLCESGACVRCAERLVRVGVLNFEHVGDHPGFLPGLPKDRELQ